VSDASNGPQLEQATGNPSNPGNRLFILWVGVGLLLVTSAVVGEYKCPRRPGGYPTFRFVGAEWEAKVEAYETWVWVLHCLVSASLFYGILGVGLFFRRGCVVMFLAGVVFAICVWCLFAATYVDL
jgi:hypothetical protein